MRAAQGKRGLTAELGKAGLSDVQIACNPWFAPAIKEQPLTAHQTRERDNPGLMGESPHFPGQ